MNPSENGYDGDGWYHSFKDDRINDHHLSLDEKRAAMEAAK